MFMLLADIDTNWAALGVGITAVTGLIITVAYIVSLKGDIRVEKEKGTGRDARLKKAEENWASLDKKVTHVDKNVAIILDRLGGPGDSGTHKAIQQ